MDCQPLTAEPAPKAPSPAAAATATATAGVDGSAVIYDAGLKGGWQDWGWGAHELPAGPARINLSQYGGWILHHDALNTRFGSLTFRMLAPSSFGSFLQVQLANGNGDKSMPTIDIGPEHARSLPGGWVEIIVPWSQLNPTSSPVDRVILHAKAAVASDWVQFDKLALTRFDSATATATAVSAPSPARRVSLSVSCRSPGHPISPYVYGVAGEVSGDLPATARRWGGNPTSRYNWQVDAFNSAKDWYFENQKSDGYRAFLASNRAHHAMSALTVPMIGWVAKDTTSVGFPVSTYGPQKGHDPYRPDAGDGTRPDGAPIHPQSPALTSEPAPPEMMRNWVEAIRKEDEKSASRNVKLYFLDNEPNLWNSTHRDIHPDPLSYDELLDRSIKYGSAIRAADPRALIAGPAEWGWTGYFYSATDSFIGVGSRPDRRAHGDVPLIPWYLKKMREHDKTSGTRVLDVLDVHYYPQAKGVYGSDADPATAALRLRSTRSLWDPSYTDESWVNDTVRLLPRLKEWVANDYPGLGISIGEYNFGGEQHISGGLALAEALGRFGVAGIDYAFYWFLPPKNSPAYWAFRAYRDFDGKGAQFLGHSLDTQMDPSVSLFASRDDSGKHLVLIALNLDPAKAAQVSIDLAGCSPIATRRSFSYGAGSASLVDQGSKSGGSLDETLAPYSINVFDVTLK
ncbi:MAG: glycoside hydrolase family 44 protein [Polyangiaceae bacterium]